MCIGLNTSQNPAKKEAKKKLLLVLGKNFELIKSQFLGVYSMPFLHVHLWYCGARSSVHLFSCRGSEKGEFEKKKPFSGGVPRFSGGGKTFREK